MATIAYGNMGASGITEVISIRSGKNQQMIDVTSMTVGAQNPRVYVPGLVGGEASVEAYGAMPARGTICTINVGTDTVFEGKVVSTGVSGQLGGVLTHTCNIRLETQ